MNILKKLTKSKTLKLPSQGFKFEPEEVNKLNTERLKELLLKYNTYVSKLKTSFESFNSTHNELLEEHEFLKQTNKDLILKNTDLFKTIELTEYQEDFISVFKKSVTEVFSDLGVVNYTQLEDNHQKIKEELIKFEKSIAAVALDSFEGRDDHFKSFQASTENLRNQISVKTKVIGSFINIIKNDYNCLLNALQDMYFKLSNQKDLNSLKKYLISDLQIISKAKLESNSKTLAQVKKENSRLNTEYKLVQKTKTRLLTENSELMNEINNLELEIDNMKVKTDSLMKQRNTTDSEMTGHMDLIKMVQTENYDLNMKLIELTKEKKENALKVDSVRNDMAAMRDKYEKDRMQRISLFRTEKVKYEQMKIDCQAKEEKCKKLEKILKTENDRYEKLHIKYMRLQSSSLLAPGTVTTKANSFSKANSSLNNSQSRILNKSESKLFSEKKSKPSLETKKSKPKLLPVKSTEHLLIKEQLENLKFKLIRADTMITTERNVFSTILNEKEKKISQLEKVI